MDQAPDRPETIAPDVAPSRGISPGFGCGVLLVVLVMGLICVRMVGALVFEGELRFRSDQPDEIRLWLVEDGGIAGLGFSYAIETNQALDDGRQCYLNRVRFLLWRGAAQGQPAEFCRCYQSENGVWVDVGACADF